MAKPYKYKGILGKKRKPLTLIDKNPIIENALRIVDELDTQALIRELFADCGAGHFNPDAEKGLGLGLAGSGWRQVALTLAERHVKGFQRASNALTGRGRPRRGDEAEIWGAVTSRLAKGLSLRQAACYVAKDRRKGETPGAIDRAYRRYIEQHPERDVRRKSKRYFAAKSG